MSFEFLDPALLLAAFAGGLFGAAIGALPAFIFTGFAVLLGVAAGLGGSEFNVLAAPDEPQGIAFGVDFGPHISFAGGAAAAAAFAARRGDIEDGKNIATPLAGLGTPWPLLVGGLFGVGGLVVQQLLVGLLGTVTAVTATDTIAVTVVISAIVARLAFGRTGLFGNLPPGQRTRPVQARRRAGLVGIPGRLLAGQRHRARLRHSRGADRRGLRGGQPRSRPNRGAFGLRVLGRLVDTLANRFRLPGNAPHDAARRRGGGRSARSRRYATRRGIAGRRRRRRRSSARRTLLPVVPDPRRHPRRSPANAIWVMATVVFVFSLLLG